MATVAEPALDPPEIWPPGTRPLASRPRVSLAAVTPSREPDTIIARPRLLEQLERAGRVTVVSAPAGSGKTSLLRSWIREAGLESTAAWLPLARADRDPQRFWESVLHAVRQTKPGSAVVSEAMAAPDLDGWTFVDGLMGDLAELDEPLWLVIDDLDELDATATLRQLELLMAHAPEELRFALSTRRDLPLGLHLIRLEGELTELRGADLRFSLDEARELFDAAKVPLSESALAVLVDRTEGWAAGLRLAAISLAQHPDPERFVAEFSGSERTVAEYLLAEVLERLPVDVRELLLRTSVLDRVSGPLADHLTGGSGSERILQELEDANAFVTSLDARRTWFRYHHLFADLLRLKLRSVAPESVGGLHRAAAQWFEDEGDVMDAIRHAQAARDWPLASRLLADKSLDLVFDGRLGQVAELLAAFPGDVATADGELALVFATERLLDGDHEESAAHVEAAQRLLAAVPDDRRHRFDLVSAEMKLVLARWRGDVAGVLEALPSVEAALAAQPVGQRTLSDARRSAALLNVGIAELWSSRLDDARRDLEQALTLARRARRPWLEIPCLGHLAIACPSFSGAVQLSDEAVTIAEAHGWSEDPALVTGLAAGALALLWQGRFDEAEIRLERAERTLNPDGEPGTELIVHHARGLLHLAHGQLEEALSALLAAQRMQALLADEHPFAVAGRTRLIETHTRMGRLDTARAVLAAAGEQRRDIAEMRVARAIIHLAESDPEQAIDALAPVIDGSSQALHQLSARTEAQVLDAVACEQLGDRREAEGLLERALELAEPDGIILPFLLAPVRDLLEQLPRHRTAHATLITTILDVLGGSSAPPCGEPAPLLDELSGAELRVVRYLPSNLKAPEIAAELCVSANTVRTHMRHIYLKLDVHGRADAVARARQLGLLAPSHRPR
jgi:LuxR family maltose regulon positive regulatory protein